MLMFAIICSSMCNVPKTPVTKVVLSSPELGFDSIDPSFPSVNTRRASNRQSVLHEKLHEAGNGDDSIFSGSDIAMNVCAVLSGKKAREKIIGHNGIEIPVPYFFGRQSDAVQWEGFRIALPFMAQLMTVSCISEVPTLDDIASSQVAEEIAIGSRTLTGVSDAQPPLALVSSFEVACERNEAYQFYDSSPSTVFLTFENLT